MNSWNVLLMGVALAMDACGVALSIGINCQVDRLKKVRFALSFAFFQFAFAFIGAALGRLINQEIAAVPTLIGGLAILGVGIMMIREGAQQKEECILIKPGMEIVLGVSVSIDAMIVGITALYSRGEYILQDGLLIGVVTLILVSLAFVLSKRLQSAPLVTKYADFIGGAILLVFGLRMAFL
ncbi:manganese efflux pump MntP [anaerobic digester metagenome]